MAALDDPKSKRWAVILDGRPDGIPPTPSDGGNSPQMNKSTDPGPAEPSTERSTIRRLPVPPVPAGPSTEKPTIRRLPVPPVPAGPSTEKPTMGTTNKPTIRRLPVPPVPAEPSTKQPTIRPLPVRPSIYDHDRQLKDVKYGKKKATADLNASSPVYPVSDT